MEDPASRGGLVNLLWTGGWDSTFRLLDLLLVKGRPVQPYYFIRTVRRSFATEIVAMNAVRRRLRELHPGGLALLKPTIFRDVDEIPEDPEITGSYERINARTHIGIQYEWGARFARAEGVSPLELSLIAGGHMFGIFEPFLFQEQRGDDFVCEIDRRHEGTDLFRLFKDYRFPLIMTTKQEMFDRAKRHGFEEFMHMTVFCSNPGRRGRPCGLCIPCGVAVENGLSWRLPPASRVRHGLQGLYRKGTRFMERFPRIFPLAQKLARAVKNRGKGRRAQSPRVLPPRRAGRPHEAARTKRMP